MTEVGSAPAALRVFSLVEARLPDETAEEVSRLADGGNTAGLRSVDDDAKIGMMRPTCAGGADEHAGRDRHGERDACSSARERAAMHAFARARASASVHACVQSECEPRASATLMFDVACGNIIKHASRECTGAILQCV
eukprot:6178935-Pleurochrysis_carterae.AAC.5